MGSDQYALEADQVDPLYCDARAYYLGPTARDYEKDHMLFHRRPPPSCPSRLCCATARSPTQPGPSLAALSASPGREVPHVERPGQRG
ncbi:protein of unknown function [Streptantibioticus cattleyicolor NRRL 8057 = DSM 46488]|nr:protein of unknown function [Streptantibioticus cattleyicolor NRRL 8057 = DSM 46488]